MKTLQHPQGRINIQTKAENIFFVIVPWLWKFYTTSLKVTLSFIPCLKVTFCLWMLMYSYQQVFSEKYFFSSWIQLKGIRSLEKKRSNIKLKENGSNLSSQSPLFLSTDPQQRNTYQFISRNKKYNKISVISVIWIYYMRFFLISAILNYLL